jgi:hypothetical protein
VDNHDVFFALSKGYQYIISNDMFALAKVRFEQHFQRNPYSETLQNVSDSTKRRVKTDTTSLGPSSFPESETPAIITFQDFCSASLSDSESDQCTTFFSEISMRL